MRSTLSPKGARAGDFGDRAFCKCRNSREGLRPSEPRRPFSFTLQRAGGSASAALRMRLGVSAEFRAGGASPHSKRQSRRPSVDT